MRYDFPQIRRIEDVLPAIEGEHAFIVAQRDYGTIINYRQMGNDVFPPVQTHGGSARMRAEATRNKILRRECRGLIFDLNGDLISRPYHKFFNAGERTETLLENIPFDQPHHILEKLDGCLTGDTKVTTPYGQMTMAEICASDQHTPVLAYDHALDREVWAEVIGTSVKESADNWYQITLDDGRTLNLTDNHKVWCVNKNQYLTVADLDEGDEVRLQED